MHIMEVPKRQKRAKKGEIFQETMADPYPNLMINLNLHIQKAQKNSMQERLKENHTLIPPSQTGEEKQRENLENSKVTQNLGALSKIDS